MTLQSQNLPVHIVTLPIPESGVVFSLVEAGRVISDYIILNGGVLTWFSLV